MRAAPLSIRQFVLLPLLLCVLINADIINSEPESKFNANVRRATTAMGNGMKQVVRNFTKMLGLESKKPSSVDEEPKPIGPVVMVTGANRGLGLEMVRQLVQDESVAVVFAAHYGRLDGELKQLVEEYSANQLTIDSNQQQKGIVVVEPIMMDIRDETSVANGVEQIAQRLASLRTSMSIEEEEDLKLNTLINNAGFMQHYNEEPSVDPLTPSKDVYMKHLEINAVGTVLVTSRLIDANLFHPVPERARIAFVSSTSGSISWFNQMRSTKNVAYGMSKAALNYYMKGLSLFKDRWLTQSICPGWVATDMGNKAKTPQNEGGIKPIDESVRDFLDRVRKISTNNTGKFYSLHKRNFIQF